MSSISALGRVQFCTQAPQRGKADPCEQTSLHSLAQRSRQPVAARSFTIQGAWARATPDVPPEWSPPSQTPEGLPGQPPEFTPPGEPGTTVRPPPEYSPPEQNPNEAPRRGDPPMRPIRPEEEPKVPEPDSPFADPIRTPERREEIMDPKKDK